MTLDIEIAGGGYWRFKLVKDVPAARQSTGDWKLAPEAGAFGVGPLGRHKLVRQWRS